MPAQDIAVGPKWVQRRTIAQNRQQPPQATKDLVSRLKQESNLEGHSGCVNCLDWNQRGDLLASGSDDRDVIIWDPFRRVKRTVVHTGHGGNIFSVKFMPDFSDTYLATCASDGQVKLIDTLSQNVLMNCTDCHHDRVKRLAVHHNQPHLIWSAGEDGLIMQYDIREEHRCSSQLSPVYRGVSPTWTYNSPSTTGNKRSNLLIDLKTDCFSMSAKCLAVNPIRDEILAIGSNDTYTRLFDRRFINRNNQNSGATTYFTPGHPLRHTAKPFSHGTTYLAFSPNGFELLVNMHAEQIYLFNTYEPQERYVSFETHLKPLILDHAAIFANSHNNSSVKSSVRSHVKWEELRKRYKDSSDVTDIPSNHKDFCFKIREKLDAGSALDMKEFQKVNQLVSKYENCPELYQLRASSLIQRSWRGDYYQALRDSLCALALKPLNYRSIYDISRAFYWLADRESASGLLRLTEIIRREFGDCDNVLSGCDNLLAGAIEMCMALLRDSPCGSDQQMTSMESDGELSHDSSNDSRADPPSPPLTLHEDSMSQGEEILFMPSMLVDDPDLSTSPEQLKDLLRCQRKSESQRRSDAFDYSERFCGHCNFHTDIKEANFFGNNGEFIVAGSDDGALYIWDKSTGNIVNAVHGDAQILNCVQPHPRICMLATSGIEPTVKLWSSSGTTCRDIKSSSLERRCIENQNLITAEPLDAMIMMLYSRTYN